MRYTTRLWRLFRRDERGTSVTEFALLAPFLLLTVAGVTDLSFAIADRMELDRNVRAGAQAAMVNVTDPAAIRSVILAAASRSSAGEDFATGTGLTVTVQNYCSCGVAVSQCDVLCPSNDPPDVYYEINAARMYDAALLPDIRIESDARIQIR